MIFFIDMKRRKNEFEIGTNFELEVCKKSPERKIFLAVFYLIIIVMKNAKNDMIEYIDDFNFFIIIL